MSKKKISQIIEQFATETILQENIENIVGERFGRYSKYIIQDRALPDVRDGLKPVQRRILYAMYKLGMFSNRPYKKSARIVGEVIGKYHPHGDTSVYDAMVRMSQNFKMLLPLIDMHGNNGSIDGDPPAAMRYTETRLSIYAEKMLADLNKRTVGFIPNFDDEEYEPIVLPSKFPNLLVNGSTGISAGYATDIPPHNVSEIIDAVIYLMDHKDATLEDLMKIVEGPDFPTGGTVQGMDGIKEAYRTGRGKIIINAKSEIVEGRGDSQIIITEIPFEVNKAQLVKRMNDIKIQRGIDGVKDIRDESDREGLRIVIDVKKEINTEFIRNFFFKTSDLQKSYNFNMVAIHNNRPVLMGLISILEAYIAHQKEIITNRSNFELAKAERRKHIVEGLISMVSILDAVIQTIRNSQNKKDAKENIITNYGFSDIQAEAIVMLQLYKLTNTDIYALRQEDKELTQEIKYLKSVLQSDTILQDVIKQELLETKQQINVPRKTVIVHDVEEIVIEQEELIVKEEVFLIITHDGYLKRLSKKTYAANQDTIRLKEGDIITATFEVMTTDTLIQFTDLGNYVYLPIHKIPEVKNKDLGIHVSTLIGMEADEKIIFSTVIDDFKKKRYVLLATKDGLIKRMIIKDLDVNRYSKVLRATKLRDGDIVVSADICNGEDADVVIGTKDGFMNRYPAKEVSILAPPSYGVKSIEMKSRTDDYVVSAKYVRERDIVVLLTNRGHVKRLRVEEINKGRKNHVGKMYLKLVKSNHHEAVTFDIIHRKNANSDLDSYIFCEKGFIPLDYAVFRTATADNGKKMLETTTLGKPIELVISRNNIDFEE